MAPYIRWLPACDRVSRGGILVTLLALVFLLAGCGGSGAPDTASSDTQASVHAGHDHDHDHATGPMTAIRHICPMHPNIVQDEPGRCPICGMNLVAREVPLRAPAEEPPVAPLPATQAPARTAPIVGGDTVYVCPMHPHITDDKPSACPICGMDLVPRASSRDQAAGVALSPALQQSLGVRVGHPERRSLAPVFRVGARVVPDAGGVVRLSTRSEGWIERLHVRAVGDPVRRGAVVAEIYSPDLVQAQEELLLGGRSVAGARERLRRLGVADSDIAAIERAGESRRRLSLRAPVDGVVAELGVRDGGAVAAGDTIMEITPRSEVWIEALLFPAQRMQLGERVEGRFTMPGLAGTEWQAEASYIAPSVDPVTQTVAVRFPIPEAGDALALGAWLDAEIAGASRDDVLVVPSSAVIRTRQGNRVVRLAGEGQFEPVTVETGVMHGGWTEIVSGVSEADGIVLSGQFLLDSEAELTSGLQRMQAHDHSGGH